MMTRWLKLAVYHSTMHAMGVDDTNRCNVNLKKSTQIRNLNQPKNLSDPIKARLHNDIRHNI